MATSLGTRCVGLSSYKYKRAKMGDPDLLLPPFFVASLFVANLVQKNVTDAGGRSGVCGPNTGR